MAQNTNFKGNKNNNQKRNLPYIKARIDKLVDVDDCNTKAFASVTVGGAVAIHGIRVMSSRKGLFVAMPASNYVDENGETKFSEIAHPISKESRDISMSATEDILKGKIAIIKHTDDGSTKIETPEKGAEFQLYLKSSGSYLFSLSVKSEDKDFVKNFVSCSENSEICSGKRKTKR